MTDKDKLQKSESSEVGFYGSLFASVSLPASTPKKRHWTRTNGRDTLIIEAGTAPKIRYNKIVKDENRNAVIESLKVPAGIIPRHIMLYFSYVWVINRQKGEQSKTIYLGSSLSEFLKRINMTKGGKQYSLLIEQIRRLFNCRIGTIKETQDGIITKSPKPIIEESQLWWSFKQPDQKTILPSKIKISESLANILDKSFPLNLQTVEAIGKNVLAFDLYSWLTSRHYSLTTPKVITYENLHEQFGSQYKELRDFKIRLKKAFELVKTHYKHNSIITEQGIELRKSKTDIEPKNISSQVSKQFLIDMNIK